MEPPGSIAVGAAAGQHAGHENEPVGVPREPHAPVADSESPFVVGASQPDDIADRWIVDKTIKRLDDAPLHRPIEAPHVP